MTKIYLSWLLALFFSVSALAHDKAGEPLDLQTRYGRYYTTFVVNPDGTATESTEWSMTVLKESAIRWAKRATTRYSTSTQNAEVIEAYTQKADGRRIDVPKDNYQTAVHGGKGKHAPVYSDYTSLTVVFPDVEVGDTVVFSYRLTQTEPLFPGHFSVANTFSKQIAFDDVRVKIDYPATLWVQYDANGMIPTPHDEQAGRKIVEWRYTHPRPVKSKRLDYSVYDPDKEVGYAFSTFKSYADIAAAYGARALPKAAVTERIKTLAAEIVQGKTTPRDQAHALYDWVATQITYAGHCIGIGAVVPRDLSFVLDNKIGDCKDQATLLQALLTAQGIKSTQALINSGAVYRLPKIPVLSRVNHVINYLPAFDLYVDATSNWIPFGMLPIADQDKPVLWVEDFKEGTKTPPSLIGANKHQINSNLTITEDGAITGTVEVIQQGYSAAEARAWARHLDKNEEADLIKNMFRSQNMIASGTFEKDDPTALADHYRYKAHLSLEKFTKRPGAGAFYIYPLIASGSSVQHFVAEELEPEKEADIACSNGMASEEYTIKLPKTMKVLSIPDDLNISNEFLSYTASYKLQGNLLKISRMLDDRTKGNVCSPQTMAQYKTFAEKVIDNLREQVLYK